MRLCSVEGCGRLHNAHGLCTMHEQRLRRSGELGELRDLRRDKPKRVCSVEGCTLAAMARGWCQTHYVRWKIRGDPLFTPYRTGCTVEGCENRHRARGLCDLHYQRWMRTGSTEAPVRSLKVGRYQQVKRLGHPLANPTTGRVYFHRVVLHEEMQIGSKYVPCFWCGCALRWTVEWPVPPDGILVDHVDHDRHNNDPTNLVPSCGSCNSARRLGSAELVSQYVGVELP